jgi:hypothetical protein
MGSFSRRLGRALRAQGLRSEPVGGPPIHAEARAHQLAQAQRDESLADDDYDAVEYTAGRVGVVDQDGKPITLVWGMREHLEWSPMGVASEWTPYLRALQIDEIVKRELRVDLHFWAQQQELLRQRNSKSEAPS